MGTSDTKIYSNQKEFKFFVDTSHLYLLKLSGNKIDCDEAKETDSAKYRKHLKGLRKEVFPSTPTKKEFLSIHDTIGALTEFKPIKKIFCRNGNCYLVKKYFTEGIQCVERGEIHTYQPHGQPLDIYISTSPLEPKTFMENFGTDTTHERISPGETKIIPSDTYYFVLASCHTFFIKDTKKVSTVENLSEKSPLFSTEADRIVMNVSEDRNGLSSDKETDRLARTSPLPQTSLSINDENYFDTPSSSKKRSSTGNDNPLKRGKFTTPFPIASTSQTEHGLVPSSSDALANLVRMNNSPTNNGSSTDNPGQATFSAIREGERFSAENDSPVKRDVLGPPLPIASTSETNDCLVPPSPKSLTNCIEQMIQAQSGCRAVFAIRKDSNVESYALMPNSTFQVHDNIITGSFAIANVDMDPYIIEYQGEVQNIQEIARFKNGSAFETTLTVQKELLDDLKDSSKKKEKTVVNYFFDYAFKAIEAAYKKFSEMRYTKMIGSCVPAIVPLSDARFSGAVPDAYEAKP